MFFFSLSKIGDPSGKVHVRLTFYQSGTQFAKIDYLQNDCSPACFDLTQNQKLKFSIKGYKMVSRKKYCVKQNFFKYKYNTLV